MPANENQLVLPVPREADIKKFQALLGTGEDYEIPHLLSCYEMNLWVMEENDEWSQETYKQFTHAKFILLRQKVLQQIRLNGRFTIKAPFDNPCTKCGGSGEIYKFARKPQEVTCMKCTDGKAKDGTKCKTCKGRSKVKTFAIIAQMKNTTPCPCCKGKGFFKAKQLDNPVVDHQAAHQLKKLVITENTNQNLGSSIETADAADPVPGMMIELDTEDEIDSTPKGSEQPIVIAANKKFDPSQDEELGVGSIQKKQQPAAE